MMTYSYAEAQENLDKLLEQAAEIGQIKILNKEGQVFILQPEQSPLDIPGLQLSLTRDDIVVAVREGRERDSNS